MWFNCEINILLATKCTLWSSEVTKWQNIMPSIKINLIQLTKK